MAKFSPLSVTVQLVRLPNGESAVPPSMRMGAVIQLRQSDATIVATGYTDYSGAVTMELPEDVEFNSVVTLFVDGIRTNFMPNLASGRFVALDPNRS